MGKEWQSPEAMIVFRSLRDRNKILRDFWSSYQYYRENNGPEASLYRAFCKIYENPRLGFATDLGVKEWYDLTVHMLVAVRTDIEHYHKVFVPSQYWNLLDNHRAVQNCLIPERLLQLACETPLEELTDPIQRIRVLDAGRNFLLAMQYVCVQIADPALRISKDLMAIDELTETTGLFEREGGVYPYVVAVLGKEGEPEARQVRGKPEILLNKSEYLARVQEHASAETSIHGEQIPCRTTVMPDGRRFLVYTDGRGKSRRSAVRKLETSGKFKDLRGWRDVVVAVETEPQNGVFVAANRNDARSYRKVARARLWSTKRLAEVGDPEGEGQLNDYRNALYWDLQIEGVILSQEDGVVIAGACEHQIQDLTSWLNVKLARDNLNHHIRRGNQLFDKIFPLYWPEHGVDWGSRAVKQEFMNSWKHMAGLL